MSHIFSLGIYSQLSDIRNGYRPNTSLETYPYIGTEVQVGRSRVRFPML